MATPLMVTGWPAPAHATVSPGRPISRLIRLSPPIDDSDCSQLAGSLNTTMSPRCNLMRSGASLVVMTRSLISMVSSIEPEGIT